MSFWLSLGSLDDTQRLAEALAKAVERCGLPLSVALNGTLGAGKTQLVRSFAQASGVPAEQVTSPTYVLHQQYVGQYRIHHFDFYRLENEAQVWDLGFDEIVESDSVIVVEWASKFPQCLPQGLLKVNLSVDDSAGRVAELVAQGELAAEVLASVQRNLPA